MTKFTRPHAKPASKILTYNRRYSAVPLTHRAVPASLNTGLRSAERRFVHTCRKQRRTNQTSDQISFASSPQPPPPPWFLSREPFLGRSPPGGSPGGACCGGLCSRTSRGRPWREPSRSRSTSANRTGRNWPVNWD